MSYALLTLVALLNLTLGCTAVQEIVVDGQNVVPGVWEVLDKIRSFSDTVRSGKWVSWASSRNTSMCTVSFPPPRLLVSVSSLL